MPETNESALKDALHETELQDAPVLNPGDPVNEKVIDEALEDVARKEAEKAAAAQAQHSDSNPASQSSESGNKLSGEPQTAQTGDSKPVAEPPKDDAKTTKRTGKAAKEPAAQPEKETKSVNLPTYAGGLAIPDECVPFIRYQRSRYKVEKCPDPEEVKRKYAQHVLEDFENMKPHLPPADKVKVILEIGCGIGALNVHLQRHYPDARIELLDGDSISREGGAGYSDKPDVYNSREVTELMLHANGCKVDRWHDIGTKDELRADLIVSLASMFYHYPGSTYKIHGTVIADLRRGAEKARGKIIYIGPKYDRCLFTL